MAKLQNLPAHLPDAEPPGGWPTYPFDDPAEWLFYRVHPNSWEDDIEDIDIDVFEMPDMSVNRSRFGEAAWVLRGHVGWGVLQFRVGQLPQYQSLVSGITYEFKAVHDPLDGQFQYPHSEIRVFNGKDRVPAPEYSPELDMLWRERLLRICKEKIKPNRSAYERSFH